MSITSLLNDSGDSKIQLPPLRAVSSIAIEHSRPSSCASTPSLSPHQTPSLTRSESSDSRAFSTPSPLTPAYSSFGQPAQHLPQAPTTHHHHHPSSQHHHEQHPRDQHRQHYYLQNLPFAKMDDQNASLYPPIPDGSAPMPQAYPMPSQMQNEPSLPQTLNVNPLLRRSDSPSSEPSRASGASASNPKSQKKNQYPCPMAKQIGCTDYFTTSGHAARHAKKHTGKKDAFCPECNKAFTRKDNMEQHRRTHQNGRGTSRMSNDDSKVKKPIKAPVKRSSVKPEPALEAAVEQELAEQAHAAQIQQQAANPVEHAQAPMVARRSVEQQLLIPATAGPYFLSGMDAGPVPSLPMAMPDLHVRPPLHRANYAGSLDYTSPTAQMIDPENLHYSYPSPGLSNGLNSLALAASEHARRRHHDQQSRSPSSETSEQKTP